MRIATILFTTLVFCLISAPAFAQAMEFQQANRLMHQQKFDEALPILERLYSDNPRTFAYFDQYTNCLVNLKMFDEAEEIAREQIADNRFGMQATMKLAEILHMSGDTDQAKKIWFDTARNHRNSIQAIYTIGASMTDRQEFDAAIELYQQARINLGDDTIFLNELANTYMQAGRFEESVNQYFRLIIQSPDQMSLVQQRFLRMRDQNLYEIAALELEDQLMDLDVNHKAYSPLYQLLAWLLIETDEYQRAFVFARQYENRTSYTIYSLFSLANQFISAREFDLAAQAYQFYIDNEDGSVQFRAMEELAYANIQWAQYLQQNNLEPAARHRELLDSAYQINEELMQQAPNYDRAERVYSRLVDLSIDHFKDVEKARHWYSEMSDGTAAVGDAYIYYAEGRIAIFEKDFTRARQALTRADRATDSSNLSERSRYYLSLSDFFAGDFEFAEIQLRSLERRHTSYYANNAIKLRMWIKNGQRADTTGSVLKTIGQSKFALHTGNYDEALENLEPVMASTRNMFVDDMTVQLSTDLPAEYDSFKLYLLNRVIQARPDSPLLERMMWDRAILVEQMYESGIPFNLNESPYLFSFIDVDSSLSMYLSAEDRFFGRDGQPFRIDRDLISSLFEDLIMQFPDGFYAPMARQKIQTIEITHSLIQ